MKLTEEEQELLTEVKSMNDGRRIFFPNELHGIDFDRHRTLWDKILDASKVDPDVVERIKGMLPKQSIDIRETRVLLTYNCMTAALYALGKDGFSKSSNYHSAESGSLAIPLDGMAVINREALEASIFTEVDVFRENGSKGLVFFENSMGSIYDHVAVYVGNNLYFHKPLTCLPGIETLDKLLEAGAFADAVRKRASVEYSFWELNQGGYTLVGTPTKKVYNEMVNI
jgi:hypothetical protein